MQKRLKELGKGSKNSKVAPELMYDVLIAAEPIAAYGEEATEEDELMLLKKYMKLVEDEATADRKLYEAQAKLDKQALAKYSNLTEDEIQTLIVDKKWMNWLNWDLQNEIDRISQRLTQRVKELAERYEFTLSQINSETTALEEAVNEHLQSMGFDVAALTNSNLLTALAN